MGAFTAPIACSPKIDFTNIHYFPIYTQSFYREQEINMSLLDQNKATIEILMHYKEIKMESGFTKIVVLEDEEGRKLLAEQEEKEEKIKELDKKKERRKNLQKQGQINDDVGKKLEEEPIEEEKPINYKVCLLKTQWKVLSWKEQTDITRESSYYNSQESFNDLDIWKFRDLRIKSCLVSWDLKDDHGNPIPVERNIIDQLPADVVLSLVSKYDTAISLTDDESKN